MHQLQSHALTSKSVVFRQNKQINLLINDDIAKQINNPIYWHIYCGRYTKQNWTAIIQYIQTVTIEQLQLADNNYPTIIQEITPIKFTNLTSLSLISNQISSIECFSRAFMPNLLYLYLGRNKIRTIASIRKLNCPQLVRLILSIFIYIYMIMQQSIWMYWRCAVLNIQLYSLFSSKYSHVFAHNCSFVMKCQSQQLQFIGMNSQNRIRQSKIMQAIGCKYPKARVNQWQQQ